MGILTKFLLKPALKAARPALKPAMITGAVAAVGGAAVVTGAAIAGVALTAFAIDALTTTPVGKDAVVFITGGSRGLGLAIAHRFAQKPVRLVLVSRKREELEHAQVELMEQNPYMQPEDFYLIAADLAKPEECHRAVEEAIARYGRIDVLVNNAGIIEVGPFEDQSLEAFERAMQVNFFAALYTTWAAVPHLRRQEPLTGTRRAAIVNIASVGGKVAVPHMLPYCAAKFALVGFSQGLHAELRHKGIRVTTVCPGLMRTGGEAHAEFVGDMEFERRWFNLAATTPGLATTARHAARRIYSAVEHGCAEITITPQAWAAARAAGIAPSAVQYANSLTNRYLLPTTKEDAGVWHS